MGLLHIFNTGVVRQLISTETNVTPAVLDEGKSIFIDMPIAEYGVAGAVVCGAWKYATQRYALRLHATGDSKIICLWIDEYQNSVTSFDSKFLAECRSHLACMVVLTTALSTTPECARARS